VTAKTAGDKDVKITIKKEGQNTSRIWIRVGVFGDQALSRQIYDNIKSQL